MACKSLMVRVEMGGHAAAASTPGASARRGAAYRMLITTTLYALARPHPHTPAPPHSRSPASPRSPRSALGRGPRRVLSAVRHAAAVTDVCLAVREPGIHFLIAPSAHARYPDSRLGRDDADSIRRAQDRFSCMYSQSILIK